ncbi:MAG: adenosylmethionine--8-amino-7-oxononanoate transaminase [Prochlorotrichaceae cyanobacterium]|jgi:adenosylmethionine-8-amino-7-oxononanoate aminotransferase
MTIWHPFTQAKTTPPPLKVKSAAGVWLTLENGQRILDAISSWWVNVHGHAHPAIAKAIYTQAQILEQVIFAGFTHEPAEQLALKLQEKLPPRLEHVFFSDNGSTAVEVALKMAYQFWVNQGQKRSTFLAFEGAYHGDTFGAMAVGERSIFTQAFDDLLMTVEFLPFPATHWGDEQVTAKEAQALQQLEQRLDQNPQKYAAVILEPLVQGAGGMRMCRPQFVQQVVERCQARGTIVIFDEIMTGFGRTGDWFACLKAQVEPDIICLSKGLTGGFLPLSVTLCSDRIYQAFYSDDPAKTLYHGHSFTANPLGCAAALAGWELMYQAEPRFRSLEAIHHSHLISFQDHPLVDNYRVTGTIAALELKSEQAGYLNSISALIRERSIAKGVLLRPLGSVVYLLPPYCITDEELSWVYRVIHELLEQIQEGG